MTEPAASVLMYADTMRSPDMRAVVPHAVADPFLYVEHDGHRRVLRVAYTENHLKFAVLLIAE